MHLISAVFLSLLASAFAEDVPKPGSVTLGSTTVNEGGYNGCPKGSVSSTIAADNSFMTLIFDHLSAQIGQGTPSSSRRIFCDVDVNINAPAGWRFCAMNADYRGYTKLDSNVNGTLKAHYSFGRGEEGKLQKNLNGPMDSDFLFHQEGEVANMLWSPCDTTNYTLKMKLSISLTTMDRNQSGMIITDSADAKFTQKLNLGWKQCPSQSIQANQPLATASERTSHQCH